MAEPSDEDLDDLVITEHQRELLSASVAVFDLELAFRIQLEEALSASLATPNPNPSSSSPPIPLPRDQVSPETKDDDLALVLQLQAQELERFNIEKKDHEIRETEIRRLTHDARLREYDEKFAREIEEMSDEEWDEYGDNFEKPVDPSPSQNPSSMPLQNEEMPFRVYFKWMASTDMVNGSLVHLAGIGVAICDPKDNLILKIQKPVQTTGMSQSRESLEAKALIEGLIAAHSIGIKMVNVYFDYRILYNHVAGIWTSKQKKVANLINQVWLHQRKFDKCKIFFLPCCHVHFAFCLARDVIDSQFARAGESSTSQVENHTETCLICLELTETDKMFSIEPCFHRFCFSCMKQYVEVKLLHGMLPFCPHDSCKVKLTIDGAKKFLTPKLLDVMTQRLKEESIPPSRKVYCLNPRFFMLMSIMEAIIPPNLSRASKSRGFSYDNSGLRKCVKCEGPFCINCKVNWHEGMLCVEYKRRNPNPKPEDAKLQSLARQRLWRQCVKCNHMIPLPRDQVPPETKVDDLALVLQLQAQELERFHIEKKDHEIRQTEIHRLTHDARLREYDEKFAREIEEMTDAEWDEYGDNFAKPVDPSPSQNPCSIALQVYFKGMASTEMVNGSLVHLAGIGVAISDPKDNMILKIQKPEILERKTGPVQKSPSDKTIPKTRPWSLVLCIRRNNLMWLFIFALMVFLPVSTGKVFEVGGTGKWDMVPDGQFYEKWSQSQHFTVGDIIGFSYSKYSLLVTNKTDFENCYSSEPLRTIPAGGETVYWWLQDTKTMYFISSSFLACRNGLKMAVFVSPRLPSSSPSPPRLNQRIAPTSPLPNFSWQPPPPSLLDKQSDPSPLESTRIEFYYIKVITVVSVLALVFLIIVVGYKFYKRLVQRLVYNQMVRRSNSDSEMSLESDNFQGGSHQPLHAFGEQENIVKLPEIVVESETPPVLQCEGISKKPIHKSGIEIPGCKRKTCKHCQTKGHNVRTCPKVLEDSKKGERKENI